MSKLYTKEWSQTIKNAKVVGKGVPEDESKKSVINEYAHSDVRFHRGDIDGEERYAEETPVMGPGSSSLGGGFRVMLSTDRGGASPKRLPDNRGASR